MKPSKLLLGILSALILCGYLFSMVSAQQSTPASPQGMQADATMPAAPTPDVATPQPGNMPMGSGMNGGSAGMNGMNGAMSGTPGAMSGGMSAMGSPCAMMGQMGSGSGMSMSGGMSQGSMAAGSMSGMDMSGANMAATSGMPGISGSGSVYDADGRFVFWNLNPWWLLGWVLLALIGLGVLASAVFGLAALTRRARRPVSVESTPGASD
jgi:hypothetical protein